MRKVQNAKLMGNGGREMEILTKNQKKKKNQSEKERFKKKKNTKRKEKCIFGGIIGRLDTAEKSVSDLRVSYQKPLKLKSSKKKN